MLQRIILNSHAKISDLNLFLLAVIHNQTFVGFILGALTMLVISGFFLTQHPKHLHFIIKYSRHESYKRIIEHSRRRNKQYLIPFSTFGLIHTYIRIVFLLTIISFCTMIIAIAIG